MDLEDLEKAYSQVSEVIENLEEFVVLDGIGKPTDKLLHHILDHLGWAESLMADEIRRITIQPGDEPGMFGEGNA